MTIRPATGIVNAEAAAVAQAFAPGLQAGHDQRDAELLNHQFAADVIWGSPHGALVDGYARLHPIHVRFQQQPKPEVEFHYRVRRVLAISEDVNIIFVRRAWGLHISRLYPSKRPIADHRAGRVLGS